MRGLLSGSLGKTKVKRHVKLPVLEIIIVTIYSDSDYKFHPIVKYKHYQISSGAREPVYK